jgi:hypothetical protein
MDITKEFGIDPEKEETGVWHNIRGGRFLLRPLNNPEYRARVFKNARRSRGRMRDQEIDINTVDLLVNTIIVDWDSDPESPTCVMEKGVPLSYSKDTARRILLAHRLLIDDISECASDLEMYQSDFDEDAAKN